MANTNSNYVDVDFSFFTSDEASDIAVINPDVTVETTKPKKKRKNKDTVIADTTDDMQNPIPGSDVLETNYRKSYEETNNMLKNTIAQADELGLEIRTDIESVRASKTLKNKYTYVTNLTGSASAILSAKITAIRELNNSITQAHNLELNRMKAVKADTKDENDDMKMMDIYSAFVNTPLGTYNPAGNPNIQQLTSGVNDPNNNINTVNILASGTNNAMAQALTPEQNRMRMESNPNIETVVVFNQNTGKRFFDVIDKNTGTSIPNYPRPEDFFLEDTTIDIHNMIAKNRNIDKVWRLVLAGNAGAVNEY